MAPVELKILTQGKDELSVGKIKAFIDSCSSPKLVLVHSSLKSDPQCVCFFEDLVNGLEVPFVGMKTSGSFTPEGYVRDGVVVGVLSGDFSVEVFHQKLDYEDLDGVVDAISPKLRGKRLCLVQSGNQYSKNIVLDEILRRVNYLNPGTQIVGGVSAPDPIVACKEGVFDNATVFAVFDDIEPEYRMYTSYSIDEDSKEYTVTGRDGHYIKEFNNENAATVFSSIYHVRPYFWNMLTKLVSKPGLAEFFSILAKTNRGMYNVIIEGGLHPPAEKIEEGLVEPLYVLNIDEEASRLTICRHIREGTILKKSRSSKEEILGIYDKIKEDFRDSNALLFYKCGMLPALYDLEHEKVQEKLQELQTPFILSYSWGEIGAKTPFKDKETHTLHAGTIQTLAFN